MHFKIIKKFFHCIRLPFQWSRCAPIVPCRCSLKLVEPRNKGEDKINGFDRHGPRPLCICHTEALGEILICKSDLSCQNQACISASATRIALDPKNREPGVQNLARFYWGGYVPPKRYCIILFDYTTQRKFWLFQNGKYTGNANQNGLKAAGAAVAKLVTQSHSMPYEPFEIDGNNGTVLIKSCRPNKLCAQFAIESQKSQSTHI